MNDVRLVVADVDLTLESREFGMPRINVEAMKALHEAGILFGVASGRSISQIRGRADDWGIGFVPELLIGVNGSSYYDGLNDSSHSVLVFEKEWIREIRDFLHSIDVKYYVYIDDYTMFEEPSERYHALLYYKDRDIRLAKTPDDIFEGNFYKFLLLIEDPSVAERFVRDSAEFFAAHRENYKLLKTTPISYEVVHSRTSKAVALEAFCQANDIDMSKVVAFGDADNDIEMIQAAGTGVCMRNGTEQTKAAADYVTELDYREGGFGDFVFRNILNR